MPGSFRSDRRPVPAFAALLLAVATAAATCAAASDAPGGPPGRPRDTSLAPRPPPPEDLADVRQQARAFADAALAAFAAGRFRESWTLVGPTLRRRGLEDAFVGTLSDLYRGRGTVLSRQPAGLELTTVLADGTRGEFAIVRYASEFAAAGPTEEVLVLEWVDGQWWLAGLSLKP